MDTVEHLLVDIDQSVRKAAGDEEMVFATLYTYDQQLEESLSGEIGAMNETLSKLSEMRGAYEAKIGESQGQLQRMSTAAHNSEQNATSYQAGTVKTSKQFDSLSSSVRMLSKILRGAAVTPNGVLVTPEAPDSEGQPARIFAAIRKLLAANRVIQPHFADVFSAFAPQLPSSPAHVRGRNHSSASQVPASHARRVRVTPKLLARTISALDAIQARLSLQKAQSLTELQSQQQALASQASAAQAQESEQQGIMAESEEVLAELAFSITFTEAVVGLDRRFLAQVHRSVKAKAEMVETIRAARNAQLKTITGITDLLSGKYTVDAAFSLLETSSQSQTSYPQRDLLLEIETALRHKQDTHGILVRIKAMLDNSSAVVHPAGVKAIVKEFGCVLTSLDLDQARADDARQKCEAQKLHSAQEQEELKENLAVMSSVQEHTKAALWAARSNMKRIVAKRQALKGSAKVFSHTVSQAMSTLAAQSNDRKTMIAAIEKAGDVVEQSLGEKSAAIALLDQLHKELSAQEQWEAHYREEQSAFHASFLDYVGDYLQVLRERRGHYEHSLSALELYVSEVQGDAAAGAQALGTSGELASERKELCESIKRFYERHHQRHLKLADSVRSLLPRVSELLDDGTA